MKAIKIYLIIVSCLLVLALLGVIYVWSLYQDIRPTQPNIESEAPIQEGSDEQIPTGDASVLDPAPNSVDTPEVGSQSVSAASLSPAQREILEAFGFSGETFTISDELLMCAEEALGASRLAEILNGAAPSPFEALSLVPCSKL